MSKAVDYLEKWQKENLGWIGENGHKAEDWEAMGEQLSFEQIGQKIGRLVDEKNIAYGDSFKKSSQIIEILYPSGINPNQYQDLLYIVRVIDKLSRIATANDKFGENPAQDIAGYSILKVAK